MHGNTNNESSGEDKQQMDVIKNFLANARHASNLREEVLRTFDSFYFEVTLGRQRRKQVCEIHKLTR